MARKTARVPNAPKSPKQAQLPVDVDSYMKRGKRVKGYKRRRPGDGDAKDRDKK